MTSMLYTGVHWFKNQGLFLDRNKALTEDEKTGVESLLTGTESNKAGSAFDP